MSKNLIIFTDSGDTIIDESTEVYNDRGIVTRAEFIPGAGEMLKALHDEGYRIALVADGEWESFQNVYRENGLGGCFEQWIVSEVVGEQKPARIMFETAMEKMSLTEADKPRIVMVGNNLKKDVAGANRFGITSIWFDWSPRYFHNVEEPDWQADYTVKNPGELKDLIDTLEKEHESGSALIDTLEKEHESRSALTETLEKEHESRSALIDTLETECENRGALLEEVDSKLEKMVDAFTPILYEQDDTFMDNMKNHNLAGDDISKYQFWEWTQGVGLYGLWKLFCYQRKECYIEILRNYYDRQINIGFPALNVNTAAPYLAMSFLAEYTGEKKYMDPCIEAAEQIMESFPRTKEGGFQHMTSDSVNEQELWDDTLYMTVLFLANMGRILKDDRMTQEAQYQFLIHEKYLCDKVTGLWYHGWTFKEMNNFAGAFWGRGNCWITMAIPEFLSISSLCEPKKRMLTETLHRQVESLKKYQAENGMWHTLIDDESSYLEASATCGFAYGILKSVKDGLIDSSYRSVAEKALRPIMDCISDAGVVNQVSYGTPMGRISKDFYKEIELKPMPYGQAMAILFLLEFRSMC